MKPAYEKAAKNLEGLAKVAAVDCDEESNKPLCGRMGVQGFPTIKMVTPSKKPGKPRVEDYQGPRTAKGIVDATVERIPNHVKRVTDKGLDDWLSQANETAKAILFTEKGTTGALLKALAIDFLGSIEFAQIRNKEKSAVETFGVSEFPSFVILPGGKQEALVYSGEMKKKPIVEFLGQVAAPNQDSPSKKPKNKKTSSPNPSDDSQKDSENEDTKPAHSSNEPIIPPLNILSTSTDLKTTCLSEKTGTCVLALVPIPENVNAAAPRGIEAINNLAEISFKHTLRKANLFPFYVVPESIDEVIPLKQQLGLSTDTGISVIAINAKRGWWRTYEPTDEAGFSAVGLESWIDSIRMGEGTKHKLPEEVLAGPQASSDKSDAEESSDEPKGHTHEEL